MTTKNLDQPSLLITLWHLLNWLLFLFWSAKDNSSWWRQIQPLSWEGKTGQSDGGMKKWALFCCLLFLVNRTSKTGEDKQDTTEQLWYSRKIQIIKGIQQRRPCLATATDFVTFGAAEDSRGQGDPYPSVWCWGPRCCWNLLKERFLLCLFLPRLQLLLRSHLNAVRAKAGWLVKSYQHNFS